MLSAVSYQLSGRNLSYINLFIASFQTRKLSELGFVGLMDLIKVTDFNVHSSYPINLLIQRISIQTFKAEAHTSHLIPISRLNFAIWKTILYL